MRSGTHEAVRLPQLCRPEFFLRKHLQRALLASRKLKRVGTLPTCVRQSSLTGARDCSTRVSKEHFIRLSTRTDPSRSKLSKRPAFESLKCRWPSLRMRLLQKKGPGITARAQNSFFWLLLHCFRKHPVAVYEKFFAVTSTTR